MNIAARFLWHIFLNLILVISFRSTDSTFSLEPLPFLSKKFSISVTFLLLTLQCPSGGEINVFPWNGPIDCPTQFDFFVEIPKI